MAEKPFFRQLLQASTVGMNLAFSTFAGLAIGYGLDYLFKTSPWLTIIFFFIGTAAGFRELLKIAKKEDNGPDKKDT